MAMVQMEKAIKACDINQIKAANEMQQTAALKLKLYIVKHNTCIKKKTNSRENRKLLETKNNKE